VYPRVGYDVKSEGENLHPRIKITDAPIMEISSSFIREAIRGKKDVRYMMPPNVYQYIQEMHYYEK
jgi:nicotinate-nucleotide adenylyltransferase